ncbi:hypothetical protein ACIBCO_22100 [Streptomyces violascens]|uniref:hypothetical protein n=1 Tax=Streptomyces violascens TaxID=67381 RepID=UPI0037896530
MSDEDLKAKLLKIMTEADADSRHRRLTKMLEGMKFEDSQQKALALLTFADDDLMDEAAEQARQASTSHFEDWVRERLDLYMTDAELAAVDWKALESAVAQSADSD